MKILRRNKRCFYYALYQGKEAVIDGEGYETGEYAVQYAAPVKMSANISAASGSAQVEQFGTFINYDRVIMTDDMDCPIDENTILFIDKIPEYDNSGNPLPDYRVRRVAKSLNSISYAISRVSVS